MKSSFQKLSLTLIFLCLTLGLLSAQAVKTQNSVKGLPDEVYLQEVAKRIVTAHPVQSIALFNDVCFAVIEGKINLLQKDAFVVDSSSPEGVKRVITMGGDLWALALDGLYRYKNRSWEKMDSQEYVDLCIHQGKLHGATKEEIFRFENDHFISTKPIGGYNSSDITMLMEDGSQIHADPVRIGPIMRIASYSGTLYVLQPGKLILFDGLVVNEDFIDWGRLPSKITTGLLSDGSKLYVSTNKGLGVFHGGAMTSLQGKDGLPIENTTCVTKGFDEDIWIGTARGAVRKVKNEWHYFGSDQWLPGLQVSDIAVGTRAVYVATDKGVGIINYEPYTLQKKAAFYEQHILDWGHKRLGFVHTLYKKDGEWIREVSDNDGGNTATYLAAMCYKYVVTGDPSARKEAVEAFKALVWLERISTVRGFFARAIWSPTGDQCERATQGSGGLPARWYPTKDGKWFWKGDTSSDEVTSHFYAVSLFYDLVAQGTEKEMAREHMNRIAGYILKNGYVFNDLDGKPTRWGRWNPEYLLRPYGYNDRGVNGLEVLAYMQSAFAVTGDQKFEKGLKQLVGYGYAENTIRQKNTFPPSTLAPWDDNLAFESYNTLLRYTTDPQLRSIYLRSLERSWEVKKMEHIPWFNFSYGALSGNDCEVEQSIKHLREWTLDCGEYNYRNSLRDDLFVEPGYTSYEGGLKAMSPRETSVKSGSRRAIDLDGGNNGNVIKEPTGFLRDYWMGRYHGFIQAPTTTDPGLLTVPKANDGPHGAKPYDGPDMPEF